jgi:hypothetical protein
MEFAVTPTAQLGRMRFRPNAVLMALAALSGVGGAHAAISCTAGSFSATGDAPCSPAPAGFFVPTTGATSALPAPVGFFVSTTGASAATAATPGSFVSSIGQTSAQPAPVGTFVSTAGASAATQATPGSFVSSIGQTSAQLAPVGTFVSTAGASAATQATPGSFVSSIGQTSAQLAPVGTFVSTAGASAATQAAPGSFVSSIGQTSAQLAPVGTFVSTAGASAATAAAAGSYVSVAGSTVQVPCPADSNSYGSASACRITSPTYAGGAPPGVTPLLGSNFGTGGAFNVGSLLPASGFALNLQNVSPDMANRSELTGLSLLSYTLSGLDAAFFELADFTPGTVLASTGGLALMSLRALPGWSGGAFSFSLQLLTDQYANFGQAGRLFTYSFSGIAAPGSVVPEPVSLGLVLTALAACAATARRRSRRSSAAV